MLSRIGKLGFLGIHKVNSRVTKTAFNTGYGLGNGLFSQQNPHFSPAPFKANSTSLLPHSLNHKNLLKINPACIVKAGEISNGQEGINNECYVLMHELRKNDKFPTTLSKEKLIELFFPKTSSEMALSLSNVTSVFYGVMLESCGKVIGVENLDKVSKDFFYKLGRVKTKVTHQEVAGRFDIPKDARGVVILLVSAIYNASPEYKFEIKQFNEDLCEVELHGVDRYYRISKTLNLEKQLEWPVLHNFLEGIKDELKASVEIQSEMLEAKDNGECHERFMVRRR